MNLLGTLLAELAVRRPDWQCVISTTTQTGYALARTTLSEPCGVLLSAGFQLGRAAALRRIRPTALVLAELELWPNLIRLAHAAA